MKHSILFIFACFAVYGQMCPAQSIPWSVTQGPYATTVNVFDTSGSSIFAGTKTGLYQSTNGGNVWSAIPSITGITLDILRSGPNIYLAGGHGITISRDGGITWGLSDTGLPLFPLVYALKNIHDTLYACLGDQGFFRSIDSGQHWTQPSQDLLNRTISTMIVTRTSLILAEGAGVIRSTHKGFSWSEPSGVIANHTVNVFALKDTVVFAGTEAGVFRSTDDGATWQASGSEMNANDMVTALAVSGDDKTIFAGTTDENSQGGVYRSNDGGNSWQLVNNGLFSFSIYSLFATGTEIFAGTALGISHSNNNGDSWQTLSNGLPKSSVTSLASIYSTVFAGTTGAYLFRTDDYGSHWLQKLQGLTRKNVNAVFTVGSTIFAGTDAVPKQGLGGMHRSTDYGNTWTQINNGIPLMSVTNLVSYGAKIITSGDSGIYFTTDNGTTWGKFSSLIAKTLYSDDTALYVGMNIGTQIWVYTENAGWSPVSYIGPVVRSITRFGGDLFIGTDSGVYRESASGWKVVTGDTLQVRSLWSNDLLVAAGTTKGIYLSSNNGDTWQFQQSTGIDTINTFGYGYRNLYAGTTAGVIEAPLGQYGVNTTVQTNPLSLSVTNPSTDHALIHYRVEERGNTSITVYDLLGKECARILYDERDPGEYTLEWNTSALASGTYILRLVSGGKQASAMINVVH